MKPPFKNIFRGKYSLLLLFAVLFSLSFLFNKIYTSRSALSQEVKKAEEYLASQQEDFEAVLKDTGLLNRAVTEKESIAEFTALAGKKYGLFLYLLPEFSEPQMKFWGKQLVTPPGDVVVAADSGYFRKLSNGWYYLCRRSIETSAGPGAAIAVIPVRSEFFITTDYLPEHFLFSKTADKRVRILAKGVTPFPVKSPDGTPLFYLDKKLSSAVPYTDKRTVILRFAALLFLFLFIHLLSVSVAKKQGVWKAILLLIVILLAGRAATYFFPGILNLRQFSFFDPAVYGSNAVQRSLGDLMINVILFCWIVLFAWSLLRHDEKVGERLRGWQRWAAGIIAVFLLIYSTFILAGVIRSLVTDSKISFDVTDFFSLNIHTVAGFFVLACLSLSYYYFSQLLFRFIFPLFGQYRWLIYFAVPFAGLLYLTLMPGNGDVLFFLPVLLWLLVYIWLVNRQSFVINRIRFNVAGIFSWIFVFSVSIAAVMLVQNKKVEWGKRKLIAEKKAFQTDPSSERMMSIAVKYIDNRFLQNNFHRFGDETQGSAIRDSIIKDSYSGFLNKYDTRLYAYDSSGRQLFNDDATTYESLEAIFTVQAKPTETSELYYYERSYSMFDYIIRKEVTDTAGNRMGTFFIVSNLKSYSQDALLPELFRKFKENDPENSPIYSNAVYKEGRLVSIMGNYPFPTWLKEGDTPVDEYRSVDNGDYNELWYKANKNKVVVVAREKETMLEAITLFSYIFCSFLCLVLLVQFISFLVRTIGEWKGFRKLLQFNIRSQIHSTILSVTFISFVVIGWATISFFINRNKKSNSDKLSRTMNIMVKEMQKKAADHNTFDDVVKFYDTVSNDALQSLVDEVSDIHGVDVNVYDLEGDLQVSSEANVYNKGVLSRKMDPQAFYHLGRLRQVQYIQEEKVGTFSYLSIYAPVRNAAGQVEAYVNIPYFPSKPELRQEISNFLVTIINLNAFIFLIAGLIALLITNRITRSFSIISEKMQEINLGKMNEEITWNRQDEIGELVSEYNKMVAKLGASATALAKSEREGAWREMARQVAHEIKNPLTPMKLSIQYLQKAINNNQENVKELSANVANTLVEQIDHLSKIAADFSQFANIGNTHVELFDLHDVVASLHELYKADPNVNLLWYPVNSRVMVEADKTQMNRLFTNLLTNAVQACEGNSECKIVIEEVREADSIRISIKDNGEGIPADMQDKIFVPNFTTKSSGTGLGLAMCKSIVEQAHGHIWFETTEGEGTVFYVELPLAEYNQA